MPLMSDVRVKEVVLESSGTRKPRQPISSPSALETLRSNPYVPVRKMPTAIEIHGGPPRCICLVRASRYSRLPNAPTPAIHTMRYAIEAYSRGTEQLCTWYFVWADLQHSCANLTTVTRHARMAYIS